MSKPDWLLLNNQPQLNRYQRQKKDKFFFVRIAGYLIGFFLVLILGLGKPMIASSQNDSTPLRERLINILQPIPSINRVGNLIASPVRLDGRELFDVAATEYENNFPIKKRVELIENELQGIVSNQLYGRGLFSPGFQIDSLKVEVSDRNGETVIVADDGDRLQTRQILTVTVEDAKYNGYPIASWAERLTLIIKEALIKAQIERQPASLLHQLGLMFFFLAVLLFLNRLITKAQHQLRNHRRAIKEYQDRVDQEVVSECALLKCPIAKAQSELLQSREKQQSCERILNFIKLKRRLLELGQIILLGGATTLIINLFPWTRWLRFTILEKLILLFVIIFSTGLAIRCGVVLVDRYYQTRLEEESLNPDASQRLNSRLLTYSEVVKDMILWSCILTSAIVTLSVLGINIAAFLTGAGLFGIAVTLIAQNLVKDIISGLQILHQDRYAVGDYLYFDNNLGLVEKITLSMTQIRGSGGRLITVPNGEIRVVHNLTQEWARVDFSIKVTFDSDVHFIMHLMQEIGQQMSQEPEWRSAILDPSVLVGINEIDYTGIEVQFWMKVTPKEQWSVAREFRLRLKQAFDEQNIRIGVPQHSLELMNASMTLNDNHKSMPRL
jgi:small-conductance mechanosensitive channel